MENLLSESMCGYDTYMFIEGNDRSSQDKELGIYLMQQIGQHASSTHSFNISPIYYCYYTVVAVLSNK